MPRKKIVDMAEEVRDWLQNVDRPMTRRPR